MEIETWDSRKEKLPTGECKNMECNSHSIDLFNHDLYYNVLVFDVHNSCHGCPLRSHEGGAKDDAQIAGFH